MNLAKKFLPMAFALSASFTAADDSAYFINKLSDPHNYSTTDLMDADESICGTDNLQHIEFYNGVYQNLGYGYDYVQSLGASVGAMKSGVSDTQRSYCSGTLIGVNEFLTASHCVDSGTIGHVVNFGFQLGATTGVLRDSQLIFEIIGIIDDGAAFGLDYALLRLDGTPGTAIGDFPGADNSALGWKQISVNLPDDVMIVQHPLGDEKQIEAGSSVSYSGGRIRYADLDTQPGSSGSGILNTQGQVVGVHTNGGCRTNGTGSNSGVFMQDILNVSDLIGLGPDNGLTVLSNDHSSGLMGQYFNFDVDSASTILGRTLQSGERITVANMRTGEVKTAVLWTTSNGGSIGDGHGRWDSGAAPGQWEVGDTILFAETATGFSVLSNDHTFGVVGQYFNFDVDSASAILGRTLQSGERITVANMRTGEVKTAVLWITSNGGSIGDGHGRWDSGAAPGQWEVGDILQF